jgi:hypothetical protein
MLVFNFLKKKIPSDQASRNLIKHLVDADDCWRDVCMLRGYDAPGPVATCEMAFARTAVIKDVIRTCQPEPVAKEMLENIDKLVIEGFSGQDTEASLKYYANKPLSKVAPSAVRYYEENALTMMSLAIHFAGRLSVPDAFSMLEIAPMFQQVASEAERMMKSVKIVPTRLS